jgi:hypothetical protein
MSDAPISTLDRAIGGRSSETGKSRGLTGLPDRVPYILCVMFVVAGTLAAFRVMFWWLFVPVFLIVLLVTWRFVPQSAGVSRRHSIGAIIATAGSAVWFVVQIPFASQFMVATRDPGIYMVAGAAIAHTGGSPINVALATRIAQSMQGLTAGLGPFGSANGIDVRLQGSNGVPALMAIGYWLGGVQGEILTNLVIGAVGLIALYALSRRFMGPYWALLPSFILGASMPYIYFSRTSYTEMMATVLIIVAGTWTVSAFNTKRRSDFIIAGALVGASGLTRVDGALEFFGALLGITLVVIGVGRAESDGKMRWNALLFAAGGWVFLGIGIFDLLHNNGRYIANLGASPRQLWEATAAITVVLAVACFTPLGTRPFGYRRAQKIIGRWVVVALGALLAFWLSRPWWLIDHHFKPGPYYNAVAELQAQDGLPIDGSRGYSEYSLWWFAWYFGWVFLALAMVGLCVWMFWAVTRKNAAHVVILATAAVVALLYIESIKITPDQIWAFRRVLPAITPALVLSAVITIRWMWMARRRWLRWVAIVAIAGCVIGVFIPWGKIMFIVEGGGQATEIENICSAVGDAPVVAFVDEGAPANYPTTIASVCNKQVVTVQNVSTFDWKELAAKSKEKVAVVTWNYQLVSWVKTPTAPTTTSEITFWTRHLLEPPRTASITVRSAYVGDLQPNGKISFRRP